MVGDDTQENYLCKVGSACIVTCESSKLTHIVYVEPFIYSCCLVRFKNISEFLVVIVACESCKVTGKGMREWQVWVMRESEKRVCCLLVIWW